MKTIKIYFYLLLFMFLFGATSCIDELFIEGNGHVRTEIRNTRSFDRIASSGDYLVIAEPGDDYFVEVTAESNLLPYIETEVNGSTLKIKTQGIHSLRQNRQIEVYITTPELRGLVQSGSGTIQTGAFDSDYFETVLSGSGEINTLINTDKLVASVSGSGTIYLEGDAIESEMVISGSGKIRAYDFPHRDCLVSISGSGDVYVNANRTIDAHISGSGNVNYIGHPTIHAVTSGSGRVRDRN